MSKACVLCAAALALCCAALAAEHGYEVTAASMQSKDDITEFKGNVRVSGTDLNLSADLVTIDSASGNYGVRGAPAVLEIITATITATVTAPTIDYDSEKREVSIFDTGQIVRGDLAIMADSIFYVERNGSLIANGAASLSLSDKDTLAIGDSIEASDLTGQLALQLSGSPATFSLTHKGERLRAQARQIDYSDRQGTVKLRGQASATYGTEKFTGESITYNLRLGTFEAAPSAGGRVTAFIDLP